MKVVFNCCPKPVLSEHKNGMTLFKGEKPEVSVETKLQPLVKDTVDINSKDTEKRFTA